MAATDRRKEYMMALIRLSRVDVGACAPFLEGIPESAVDDPDDGWWESEEKDILLEALTEAIEVFEA